LKDGTSYARFLDKEIEANDVNGVIPQLIALAGYGSEFLIASSNTEPPELSETNSTFQYAHTVKFLEDGSGIPTQDVSKGTKEWFNRLRAHGCSRILLEILATELERTDTTTLGWYTGEIPWAVRTIQPSKATSWLPHWTTIPEFRPGKPTGEKRIWDIAYSPKPGRTRAIEGVSLEQARSELKEALEEAIDFSSKSTLSSWSQRFEKALQNLSKDRPEFAYHHDLLPQTSYSLQARQLIASAEQAWVFGGMGSWNDIGFQNPMTSKKYNQISQRLYQSILTAFAVGVNQPLLVSASPGRG
jgi:hypothetical protein